MRAGDEIFIFKSPDANRNSGDGRSGLDDKK